MISLTQSAQWVKCLTVFWRNEEGQGVVEYVLLLSMLVGLVLAAMGAFTGPLGNHYATILSSFTEILHQPAL